MSASRISASPSRRNSADRSAKIRVIARDFTSSFLRALRSPPDNGVGWCFGANRIKEKHLLTLQEGISENQFAEMREEGIKLVVPDGLHHSYNETVRFESFIADIRLLALNP